MVGVGDALAADVQDALQAGLKAVWFNPRRQPAPENTLEIQELPQVLDVLA